MSDPTVTIRRAGDLPLPLLAEHQTSCFEGYLVDVTGDSAALADRVRTEHIDLHHSFELYRGDTLTAQVFIARRNERSRVASMGVPAPARRRGWARVAIERAITEARDRGDETLQLEVITANVAAARLYESVGFSVTRELRGYEIHAADLPRPPAGAQFHRIPLSDAAATVMRHTTDLPWQLHPASLVSLGAGYCAWTNGSATLVAKVAGDTLSVQTLITAPEHRGRGHARALLAGVVAAAGLSLQRVRILSLVPAGVADEFVARSGGSVAALRQWEMSLTP